MSRVAILAAALAVALATPAAAQERDQQHHREISPYIEAGQVLTADLQSGDVLTYSTLAAGIDASIQTQRVEVQLSYKYERRFAWDKPVTDDDVHSGLARVAVEVASGLSFEGGAVATRARVDTRGDAPSNLVGNVDNVTQVYSAYAGPTFAKRVGQANVAAAYRFAYTKAESPSGPTGVAPGQPPLDNFDSSTSHMATASIGVKSGEVLPVGVTLSGGWEHESASQLDQKYDGKHVRADAVLPIGQGVAVAGGVGYEKIEISQKDPLFDPAGNPVTDGDGRFVTDPASPQRTAFASDGVYWDAGIVWRPSRRTAFEARYGRRYGSDSFTGSFSYIPSARLALGITAYDEIQSFGRQLTHGLAMLPTSFNTTTDPFGDAFNGCMYGNSGAAGGCLNGALQSIVSSNYRARGIDGVISLTNGPLRMGLGMGYGNRRFYAPVTGTGFTVNGLQDDTFYAQYFVTREIDPRSGVVGNVFFNYFDSQTGTTGPVIGMGATGSYYHRFGPINATASVGLYSFDVDGVSDDLSAQALLGIRYGF